MLYDIKVTESDSEKETKKKKDNKAEIDNTTNKEITNAYIKNIKKMKNNKTPRCKYKYTRKKNYINMKMIINIYIVIKELGVITIILDIKIQVEKEKENYIKKQEIK